MSTPLDRGSVLEQYEALRRQALEGNGRGMCGHGLALFLSRGMSAWTSALTALVSPPSLPRCEMEGSVVFLAELPLIAKHTSKTEAVRLTHTWDAVPGQLAKENKKFRYADISKHARARDYAEALQWLADAGLVLKCFNMKTPKPPLSGNREEAIFKIYLLDVGLLGARLGLGEKAIVEGDQLFSEYNGAFVENYVAQELIAAGMKELYYWTSSNIAEVDFVIAHDGAVYPLEVKAGTSAKKKSLKVYDEKFRPPVLSRATAMNFKKDGKICNYPLYAVSRFPGLGMTSQ